MVSEKLSRQAQYVSLWRYESSHIQQSRNLDFSNDQLVYTLDILVKTLIAGLYPFDMHGIIEISDKIDIFDEKNVQVQKKNASVKSMTAIIRTNNFEGIIDGKDIEMFIVDKLVKF